MLEFVVRPERFELPTPWFVAKYSIQMSYGRVLVKLVLSQQDSSAAKRMRILTGSALQSMSVARVFQRF